MNRRAMFSLLLVAVLALGVSIWSMAFMKGPEYTLVHAAQALAQRDTATFDQYVDVPRLSQDMSGQAIQTKTRDFLSEDPQASGIGQLIAARLGKVAKPYLTTQTAQSIHDGVAQGVYQPPAMLDGFAGAFQTFVLKRNPEFQVKEVWQEGEKARIRAIVAKNKLQPTEQPKQMTFLLQRQQGLWRIIGLENHPA